MSTLKSNFGYSTLLESTLDIPSAQCLAFIFPFRIHRHDGNYIVHCDTPSGGRWTIQGSRCRFILLGAMRLFYCLTCHCWTQPVICWYHHLPYSTYVMQNKEEGSSSWSIKAELRISESRFSRVIRINLWIVNTRIFHALSLTTWQLRRDELTYPTK